MSLRKPAVLNADFFEGKATVEPVEFESLILRTNNSAAYFEQLNFKFVPSFAGGKYAVPGSKIKGVEYIPMDRENFVRDMYRILNLNWNVTKKRHFDHIKLYVRWLDQNDLGPIEGDYFHPHLYRAYMKHYLSLVNKGEISKGTWSKAKHTLNFVLRAKARESEIKHIMVIKGVNKSSNSFKGIDLKDELQPLIRLFLFSFKQFCDHWEQGTIPRAHPFYNEERQNRIAEQEGWDTKTRRVKKHVFYTAMKHGKNFSTFANHFSQLSAVIAFCFSGQNTSSILNLRHSDIRFSSKSNGKVYFDLDKPRANYLKLDTSLGFHRKAQAFFHQWLKISVQLQKDSNTDWLFPLYHQSSGTFKSFPAGAKQPHISINKLTSLLGLARITPSTLRQTKIDTLMKVTEDIWLVSMSANNSVTTIKASYSSGHESDHRRNLAASGEAIYDYAKNGSDINESAQAAKYKFRDVLSSYDYKRLRDDKKENDRQTPIGSRCKGSTQGASNIIKKNLVKAGLNVLDKEVCTDFLNCFECEFHRLVAEVEDIWLMLSFYDTLKEMKEYPSINSLPTDKYHKLCNTINGILKQFNKVSPNNYAEASKKHVENPHPLYSDAYSLIDLMEVF